MKLRRLIFALLALVLLAGACGSDEADSGDSGDNGDVTAAFIYVGPAGDLGYNWAHDQGRLAAEEATGATTLSIESVPEGTEDFRNAAVDFIDEGATLIVGTSFGYMDDMDALAAEFPDVNFEHVSGFKSNDTNFGNSFGRMYEPRYLSGMAAASVSESGQLGYVAAFPIPEVIRGINAFALGARAVNPDATVEVVWTSTWFDPAVEGDSAQALIDAGADVIAMHQDSTAAGVKAEEAGVRWVAYNADMRDAAPTAFVTAPVWNWGPRYTSLVEQTATNSFSGGAYWGGLADGVVALAPLADDVPADVVSQIEAAQADIESGAFHPFQGPIDAQDGTPLVAAGDTMADGDMLGLSVFVEGVVGSIPES